MKKLRIAFALLSLLALLLLLPRSASASPAHPNVSCSGTGCNNQDPYATGCNVGQRIVSGPVNILDAQRNILAKMYNIYSPTCGTKWNIS